MKDLRKYPFVKQDDLKDCGVACLSMIIKYYGGYINKYKLQQMTFTSKKGVTGYHLVNALKEIGFDSCGVECKLEKELMKKITLPVIAYTIIDNKYKHFVVIYEINFEKNYVYLADPATKLYKMDLEEFEKIYQNIIFLAKPLRKLPKEPKKENFIKQYIFNNKKNILIILAISFFVMVLNLISLNLIKKIMNETNIYYSLLIIYFIIVFSKNIILYIRNYLLIVFGKKLDFKFTLDILKKIISLPYSYYRNKTTGEIFSRINDINQINESITNILITIFLDSTLIIFIGGFLFYISPKLFLVSFIVLIVYFVILFIFKNPINQKMVNLKKEKSSIDSYIVESITGFESIKGLSLEPIIMNKFKNKYINYTKSLFSLEHIYNIQIILKQFVEDIFLIATILIGYRLVSSGEISLADFLIFESLVSSFITPIKNIVDLEREIKNLKLSISRVEELSYYDEKKMTNFSNIKTIKFNNVSYSHNSIDYILKNISFDINYKDKIMLIGENGSGKSTILKLIKGYYKSNGILVNDKENKNITNNVTYISQDGYLFTDTLYQNIVMDRKVSLKKLNEIVKICDLENFVNDELGYYKMIEENGFNISGGERQKILLARALLAKSDVLLIDEGLSEIDVSSERKIIKNIIKKYKNKIVIIVSHRYDNMDIFNKVIKITDKVEIIRKGDEVNV